MCLLHLSAVLGMLTVILAYPYPFLPLGELRSVACVQLPLDAMVLTFSVACLHRGLLTLSTHAPGHVSVGKTPKPGVSR